MEEAARGARESESLIPSKRKTFKMDRRSPQASALKASVLHKLLDFLNDYTDEDLAEYIVILVCNGKNQDQTRDDLEEFLGDGSARFVTWLWNHLSDNIYLPNALLSDSVRISDAEVTDAKYLDKKHMTEEIKTQHTQLSNTKNHGISNVSSHSNSHDSLEDFECSGHQDDAPSIGAYVENVKHTSKLRETSGFSDYNVRQTEGGIHPEIRSFLEIPDADVEVYSFEDGNHKLGKAQDRASQYQRSSPKEEVASKSVRSGTSNDSGPFSMKHAGERPLSTSIHPVQSENNQLRRSVWDRLGKPSVVSSANHASGFQCPVVNTTRMRRACDSKDIVEDSMPECLNLDSREVKRVAGENNSLKNCKKVVPKRHADEIQSVVSGMKAANDDVSLKRRRKPIETNIDESSISLSDCRDKSFCTEETYKKSQKASSATSNPSHILKELILIPSSANSLSKTTKIASDNTSSKRPEPVGATPVETLVPSTSVAQRDNESKAENTNHRHAKNGVQLLNMQLQQVEKEILELRSKQAQMVDTKRSLLTGPQNGHEDIDSRTVFVNNVHFAASRGALASHFSQCGPVAKVTILTDINTGLPKGCAYVAFAIKDSLEKAVSLSGTSFMSRTLKVMPKAEMPVGILDPCQSSSQTRNSPFQQRSPFPRKHPGPHLQWRRE